MKNVKKIFTIFGAVALALLMVSSATAVPQVNSQPLVKQINKEEQTENSLDTLMNDIGLLSNSGFSVNDFDADLFKDILSFQEDYLDSTSFTNFEYKYNPQQVTDAFYNEELKTLIDGVMGNLKSACYEKDSVNANLFDYLENYYGGIGDHAEEDLWEKMNSVINPIINDFFDSNNFLDFIYTGDSDESYNDEVKQLVEDLKDDISSLCIESEENSEVKSQIITTSGISDEWVELLKRFVTAVFKVSFFLVGEGIFSLLGSDVSALQVISSMICSAVIFLPCYFILRENGLIIAGFFTGVGVFWAAYGAFWAWLMSLTEFMGALGFAIRLFLGISEIVCSIPGVGLACLTGFYLGILIWFDNWPLVNRAEFNELMSEILGDAMDDAYQWAIQHGLIRGNRAKSNPGNLMYQFKTSRFAVLGKLMNHVSLLMERLFPSYLACSL